MARPEMAPILAKTMDNSDFDHSTTCLVFPRTMNGRAVTMGDVLKSYFHLNWNNYYKNEANKRQRGYRDSGLWTCRHKPNAGGLCLLVSVGVGCACSHDCCGHLCGMRLELWYTGDYITVYQDLSYNY